MTNPAAKHEWSFPSAMRDFFDNVQTNAAQFMAELKQLTDEDKAFFRRELERVGYRFTA